MLIRSYENVDDLLDETREQLLLDRELAEHYTVHVLGCVLALKDSETEDHSKRVTAYSILLAKALNLPADHVKSISRGAFLHDIGKIAVPNSILNKPKALNASETTIMRQHCRVGYQIISSIPYLRKPAEIVLCHHEFYDGRGYPDGLVGDEIPIGARIFSVADTLDAITTDRPYRAAASFAAARAKILAGMGTQFDPLVVKAFMGIANGLWGELRVQVMDTFAATA